MSSCPSSTATGCRCPEHHPGLSAYARDQDAYLQALEPLRQVTKLHVVTMADQRDECRGTMTCECQRCVRERGSRQPAPRVRQPWEPRPSRRAA